MRSRWLCALIPAAMACSSAPISFISTTPAPLERGYACALSKVNELGYTLSNTNKDAGFIQAVRHTSGGLGEALSGKKTYDQLTIAIYDAPEGGKTMRVTAGTTEQSRGLLARSSESSTAPSSKAKAHAVTILNACAPGAVKQVGDAASMSFEAQAQSAIQIRAMDLPAAATARGGSERIR